MISPLMIGISIGVKFSSRGPIFFFQDRVGIDGRHFKMWKFRTMRVGSHVVNGEPGWTTKDDDRCTRFGSFLRATSLDELPQLWNVFVGDMSLVGPRPEQPFYVNKFREEISGIHAAPTRSKRVSRVGRRSTAGEGILPFTSESNAISTTFAIGRSGLISKYSF